MSTMVPMYGFGGGSGGTVAALTVNAPAGATVTVSKDGKTYMKTADSSGVAVFKGLKSGTWTVTITDGSQTSTKSVKITTDYAVIIGFESIPEFTYTGDFEIVNDADEPITTSQDNWKIRFLTSGTLTFKELNGAENGIDVFLVGGGGGSKSGGGGGGGYTKTNRGVEVQANVPYEISVGSGVTPSSSNGGETSAFGCVASGGYSATKSKTGANGGSGGGAEGGGGGTEGGDGISGSSSGIAGKGQISLPGPNGETGTTREFGEEAGKPYAGGGAGWMNESGSEGGGGAYNSNGVKNTGGGAGASLDNTSGGSGIVIIRNAREVA